MDYFGNSGCNIHNSHRIVSVKLKRDTIVKSIYLIKMWHIVFEKYDFKCMKKGEIRLNLYIDH